MTTEVGYIESSSSYPEDGTDGIIVDLRVAIDQVDISQTHARNLILELARRFDVNKTCQPGQICSKIKGILSDKIKEHKVTERWIEKCLPSKYKGRYNKTELSSLSGRTKRNRKKTHTKESVEYDGLVLENSELKKALNRQTLLLSADQVAANEIVYTVNKDKFPQIREVMDVCKETMRLVFDKAGVLERAEPDTYGGID